MAIKISTIKDYNVWNNFVDISPQGSIFSKTWYLDALCIDYNILAILKDNTIQAGIILTKNEISLYSNPMFAKYLGVLFAPFEGEGYNIESKIYKYLEDLSKELKNINSFDYYFHPNFKNHIPMHWHNFIAQVRYTYIIDNKKSLDDIYNGFHNKIIKKNIKYAKAKGVLVKRDIEFEIFWELINKTYLRQGSKAPFSKERIKNYINELKRRGVFESFGVFENSGKCSCVCGIVYDTNSSYLLFNGIDTSVMTRGANALMIWESIKYFHNISNKYDFEGSMLIGAEPFFRKFGGERVIYMNICRFSFLNFLKRKTKMFYKKLRYGR